MLKASFKTVQKARTLRRKMTLPEVLMWRELRSRPDGVKFRRQHPVGPYVLDFLCLQAGLAIEVDGEAHNLGERPSLDNVRDGWLADQGISVMRIPAKDVLADTQSIIEQIVHKAKNRIPLHRPADGPPPRSGEDLT